MRKNRIRLNESQLRQIVKESVKRVLRESTENNINKELRYVNDMLHVCEAFMGGKIGINNTLEKLVNDFMEIDASNWSGLEKFQPYVNLLYTEISDCKANEQTYDEAESLIEDLCGFLAEKLA